MKPALMRCPRMPGITSVDHRCKGQMGSFDFEELETLEFMETIPRARDGLFQDGRLRCRRTFNSAVEQGALHKTGGESGLLDAQMSNQLFFAMPRPHHQLLECLPQGAAQLLTRVSQRTYELRVAGRKSFADVNMGGGSSGEVGLQCNRWFPDDSSRRGRQRDPEQPDAMGTREVPAAAQSRGDRSSRDGRSWMVRQQQS